MTNKIIDFHTHPYRNDDCNICIYKRDVGIPYSRVRASLEGLGIGTICGSVIDVVNKNITCWEDVRRINDEAIAIAREQVGFYVPGFHIHPSYLEESLEEMDRMHELGVNLIGELVPATHGWSDYSIDAMDKLLDRALELNMIFNFHTMNHDSIDSMVKKHPENILVAAHPGEHDSVIRHFARMEKYENYYLDLSGTGIFRQGMVAEGIKLFGNKRFLFGSDFPVCNPAVYVGGIGLDTLLTEEDKDRIMYLNAHELLTRTDNRFYTEFLKK